MTLNGFLREIGAAQRRSARNEERRQRAHARMVKLQAKIDELDRAAEEAAEYQERISQLISIHHTVGDMIEWEGIAAKPPPSEPVKTSRFFDAAVSERNRFKPGFFQRLFGSEGKIRAKLESAVIEAEKRDEVSYRGAQKLHRNQMFIWNESTCMARAVLNGEGKAYVSALEELEPLSEMQEMGCAIDVMFPDSRTAEVVLNVQGKDVVPKEAKSLTKSGKLSVKGIPESKFNELYQDYVCGCALRIARELFATLPLKRVVTNVTAQMLDTSTGHLEALTILSVAMPKQTIEGMRFETVDPSDAMKLFPHRMGFKRAIGFSSVARLEPTEYPLI
jgi:hypothetical protein